MIATHGIVSLGPATGSALTKNVLAGEVNKLKHTNGFIILLNDVCHIASPQQTPSFFQLVLFLAAAAASPQDLSPADAIFLVMNPGLGCGSRLRPPS